MYLPEADKVYLVRVTYIDTDKAQITFTVEETLRGQSEKTLPISGWGFLKDHWYVVASQKSWRTMAPSRANVVGDFNEGTCGWIYQEVSQDEKIRNTTLDQYKSLLKGTPSKS